MELIVGVCMLMTLSGLLGRKYILKRKAKSKARFVRTPRDLGALVLIERFGKPYSKEIGKDDSLSANSGENRPDNPTSSLLLKDTTHSSPSGPNFVLLKHKDPYAAISAAVQGAWFGKEPIENLLEIDEHVYTAMSQLAGNQLDSIGDLHNYFNENWNSAAEIGGLPEAAVNKLMGHLAEPIVGQHLEELGFQVEMPPLSNQSGYDFILNGEHFVNVKSVADISSLSGHFEKYPDIPAIVPGDMAGIPDNAIHLDAAGSLDQLNGMVELGEQKMVLVDNSLSHADMVDHTQMVSDALFENVDVGGVPFITIALSGFREIELLKSHDTNVTNSIKNLGLDVVGTGAGAFAGSTAGAAIGSAIVPVIGTAIGAAVGSVLGAIGGRKASNTVKEKPFQDALKAYENAQDRARGRIVEVQTEAERHYRNTEKKEEKSLVRTVENLKQKIQQQHNALLQDRRKGISLSHSEARQLLEIALNDLSVNIEMNKSKLARIPLWKRTFWPDGYTVILQQSVQHLKKLSFLVKKQAELIFGGSPYQQLEGDRANSFLQLLLAVDGATPTIQNLIRVCEERREEGEGRLRGEIEQGRIKVADRRYQCFKTLAETLGELQKNSETKIGPLVQKVKTASEVVQTEATRLGKTKSK